MNLSFKYPKVTFAAVILVASVSTLLAFAACGSTSKSDVPETLVPAGSTIIGSVQVTEILEDLDFAALFENIDADLGDVESFDQLLEMVFEETGIDFRQISYAVLFGDVSRAEESFGVIAKGVFDEDQIVAAIKRSEETTNFTTTVYKGQRLHSFEDDEDSVALSVLDTDTLVFGIRDAVTAVIDVQDGTRDPVSGQVYDVFNDLGDGLFRLALELPPEALEDLDQPLEGFPGLDGGFDGLPISLDALTDLEIIGVVLEKNGDILSVEAQLDFVSSESAARMGDAIGGLFDLFTALSPDERTRTLLDNIPVETSGTRLTIRAEITMSELEELVGTLGG